MDNFGVLHCGLVLNFHQYDEHYSVPLFGSSQIIFKPVKFVFTYDIVENVSDTVVPACSVAFLFLNLGCCLCRVNMLSLCLCGFPLGR